MKDTVNCEKIVQYVNIWMYYVSESDTGR